MILRQTAAIFLDAYRELSARKLFWIVLGLSGLFVGGLACVGINENGITILWWEIQIPMFNSRIITRALFYKYWFFVIGFKFWLTWAATILALISTAGIIPEFISSGAIELSLSKPIGRARLLLTKFFAGLLFVALQVAVFAVAAFFVVRIRGDTWAPEIFLSIPIVVAVFSFLFSICTLIGLVTRSTIAALLLTVLVWLTIFMVHTAETGVVLTLRTRSEQSVAIRQTDLSRRETDLAALRAQPAPEEPDQARRRDAQIESAERIIAARRTRLEEVRKTLDTLTMAHSILYAVKTVMPKTSETVDLLGRSLLSESDRRLMEDPADGGMGDMDFAEPERDLRVSMKSVQQEVQAQLRARSVGWVLGTSLLFEACVLALAVWVFSRRDY